MKKESVSLYACPSCRGPLEAQGESDAIELRTGLLICKRENIAYTISKGIPNLVMHSRKEKVDALVRELSAVRKAQGLEIDDWAYYARLPYPDTLLRADPKEAQEEPHLPPPIARHWKERASSFEKLYSLIRFEKGSTLVDLGAGCCWLSNRLANRFKVYAIDIDSSQYGLGVAEAFLKAGKHFERCRAEIINIPLKDNSVDIVVIARSAEYEETGLIIAEVYRILRNKGVLYILDSPFFETEVGHAVATASLQDYYRMLSLPILCQRHRPLVMRTLASELKNKFSIEVIPAESRMTAAKRSFLAIITQKEVPVYPIIRARKHK